MDEIYSVEGYRKKIDEIHTIEKNINNEIQNYSKKIDSKENTIEIENIITDLLNNFKKNWKIVDEAYINKNVPGLIPNGVRERRQIEIESLNTSIYKKLKERFEALKSKKYSYDFSDFDKKDYNKLDEYKYKSSQELMKESEKKINEQNNQLEDITLNVKKGQEYAKETSHMLSNQNEQLEYIQENVSFFINFLFRWIN
jgi:hypothetical protein